VHKGLSWETIQVLIETLLLMIDENLGGKADRKKILKTKCVNALAKIAEILKAHLDIIRDNEKLLRLLASSVKVVGEERRDPALVARGIEIIQMILSNTKLAIPEYRRGLQLDLARLYHLKELLFFDKSDAQEKVKLIRGLIRECPARSEYWVYHGIFQPDEEIKIRSFYKALQLNPKVRLQT
jgi:hypothetical protein